MHILAKSFRTATNAQVFKRMAEGGDASRFRTVAKPQHLEPQSNAQNKRSTGQDQSYPYISPHPQPREAREKQYSTQF